MKRNVLLVVMSLIVAKGASAVTTELRGGGASDPCELPEARGVRFMLKSNLLHDALLTPDVGVEIGFTPHWSLSMQGECAWWSKDSSHRYWRIAGGSAEVRYWIVPAGFTRTQTGHHIGLTGGVHSFDFEFGGKGWQSHGPFWMAGLVYGYSLPLAPRVSLDFSVTVGGAWGRTVTYHPECGVYVAERYNRIQRFGPTDLGVTLVWYPGRGERNLPRLREL